METNFIDHIRVFCAAGAGGDGSAHLHRAKYLPKGGPDGGDGGPGGNIILQADSRLWTLIHLKYHKHIRAGNGGDGGKNTCSGKTGEDILIRVPVGTVVKESESGRVCCELTRDGERAVLCHGGEAVWEMTTSSPRRTVPRASVLREVRARRAGSCSN